MEVDATFADASAVAPAIRSSNLPTLFGPWRRGLPDDLDDYIPMPRLVVQLQECDLLPGAEGGAAVDDRDREARSQRGREGRAAASSAGPPEALAGGRWLGGGYLSVL